MIVSASTVERRRERFFNGETRADLTVAAHAVELRVIADALERVHDGRADEADRHAVATFAQHLREQADHALEPLAIGDQRGAIQRLERAVLRAALQAGEAVMFG